MRGCTQTLALGLALISLSFPAAAPADLVCPDSSYVEVDYACTFTGSYRTGGQRDIVTVSPGGDGETFAENGITIRVYLRNCQGEPVVGVPAESIALTGYPICICPWGNIADGPTDALGRTTFTGTLRAGGCVEELVLEVDGSPITTVPVKTNSPDDPFALACAVGADEVARMSGLLSSRFDYTICFDFNEDGSIDAVDFAEFVSRYENGNCIDPPADSGSVQAAFAWQGRKNTTSAPRIGVFFDAEGQTCSREIHPVAGGEMWVLAFCEDMQDPGIVGAEFAITGFPPDWTASVGVLNPGTKVGTSLSDGLILGYYSPVPTERGLVTLAKIRYLATSDVPTTRLRVVGRTHPRTPSFHGPVLIVPRAPSGCVQVPVFEVVPAIGLEAVINGPCTIAVEATTWQRVKAFYKD